MSQLSSLREQLNKAQKDHLEMQLNSPFVPVCVWANELPPGPTEVQKKYLRDKAALEDRINELHKDIAAAQQGLPSDFIKLVDGELAKAKEAFDELNAAACGRLLARALVRDKREVTRLEAEAHEIEVQAQPLLQALEEVHARVRSVANDLIPLIEKQFPATALCDYVDSWKQTDLHRVRSDLRRYVAIVSANPIPPSPTPEAPEKTPMELIANVVTLVEDYRALPSILRGGSVYAEGLNSSMRAVSTPDTSARDEAAKRIRARVLSTIQSLQTVAIPAIGHDGLTEIVRFAINGGNELAARAHTQCVILYGAIAGIKPALMKSTGGKPGRPCAYDPNEIARLQRDWKASGLPMKEFAKQRGENQKEMAKKLAAHRSKKSKLRKAH